MNIWEREIEAMQLVRAMLGLIDFPMPVFFLNVMWIITFLLLVGSLMLPASIYQLLFPVDGVPNQGLCLELLS